MITRQEFIESFTKEIDIIRHLATKVTPAMLDYRPHEKQRSMQDLMQYLGHIFDLGTTLIVNGNSNNYMDLAKNAPTVTLVTFDHIMKDQSEHVVSMINGFSDESLTEEIEIFGRKASRAMHMLGVMKWAVAYKMQLFLYIKACGNHDISTMNLWVGVDPSPKE